MGSHVVRWHRSIYLPLNSPFLFPGFLILACSHFIVLGVCVCERACACVGMRVPVLTLVCILEAGTVNLGKELPFFACPRVFLDPFSVFNTNVSLESSPQA